MPYEKLTKLLNPFKNQLKRQEFEAGKPCFDQYILVENPAIQVVLEQNLEDEACKDTIGTFLCQIGKNLDKLADRSNKKIINTGIEQKVTSLLFELKTTKIENFESKRVKSKIFYLKKLILDILSTYEKCSNDVENSIVQYGGLQIVLKSPIFEDKTFRNLFKNILDNCKTFNEVKKHRGIDIDLKRSKLAKQLSKCLISLRFNQEVSQNIITQLLENPLSHVVAINQNLTSKQKISFYCSQFYKSQTLKQYAHILEYEKCLHYKTKKDISTILQFIEQQNMITNEIIGLVMNFKVYELLKIKSLNQIKRSLFRLIFDQCPDYIASFKLIQYRKKSNDSLKENQSINQKMLLIGTYLKIHLPFEEWQIAEKEIMSRNYSIIDELSLNLVNKKQLLQYIFQVVQPYFHLQQKFVDFRSQTELALIQEIMKTDDSEFVQFENILPIISSILEHQDSPRILSKKSQASSNNDYICNIINSQKFSRYKENMRGDIKEENYLTRIELRKSIYNKSFQEKTLFSFEKIEEYVNMLQKERGQSINLKIYPNISQLLCYKEKNNSSIQCNVEIGKAMIESTQQASQLKLRDEKQLRKQLLTAIQAFVSFYLQKNAESYFEKYLIQKYHNNKVAYIKTLAETNAFNDEKSDFFESLQTNKIMLRKVKAQFVNNAQLVKPLLQECNQAFSKLANSVEKNQLELLLMQQEPEEKFKVSIKCFFENYFKENKESLLERILYENYSNDMFKLANAIIEEKPFENLQSPFFNTLGKNKILLKKIKAEFKKNQSLVFDYFSKRTGIKPIMK